MPVVEIPPGEFGLITVSDAAALHGCDVRTVQRWIAGGMLPALVCGSGNRTAFMVRATDAKAFAPRAVGRPAVKAETTKPKPAKKRPVRSKK